MKVLGITGGIGCGKSTIVDIINNHYHCFIINTDLIAADLMKQGHEAYDKIVEYFGLEILSDNGEINRRKLANRVFKSEMDLLKLNSFTHPLVREKVLDLIKLKKEESKENTDLVCDFIIIETALPYEARLKDYCDEVWYVTASLEIRRERLIESRHYSDEKINDIFNKQLSDEDYINYCTHVIVNNTTKEDVLLQIKKLQGEEQV